MSWVHCPYTGRMTTSQTPSPLVLQTHLHLGPWQELQLPKAATLAIVDPPWTYHGKGSGKPGSSPEQYYAVLSTAEIMGQLDTIATQLLARDSRLVLWATWPLLPEIWGWVPPGFKLKTGGSWTKSKPGDQGHYGPGYHWAGCSEPVLIFTRGAPPCHRSRPVRNAWIEPPGPHSRKPVLWQRQLIERWTDPGDLVLDPYAGLGSVLAAASGVPDRLYRGAELDAERHRLALQSV